MKRFIASSLSILLLVLALTSCTNNTVNNTEITSNTSVTTQATSTAAPLPTVKREYTALVYDFADGFVAGEKDIDLKTTFKKKNPAPSANLTINGNTYSGKYNRSWNSLFYGFNRDEYVFNDITNGITIEYTVNANTGKVEAYYFSNIYDTPSNYEGRKTYLEDECLKIAKEYMKQYVPNIEKYTLVNSTVKTNLQGYDTEYDFKFREYIGDIPIGNDVFVDVNMYGDIVSFDYHTEIEDVEEFKESGFLDTLDWDAIDEVIAKRACEAFKSVDGFDDYFDACRYDESKSTKTLVKMKDGRYVLKCQAYVFMYEDIYPYPGRYESVLLMVYID
ncbi:MAG: hypothetical protein IJW21_08950 [Clostridia bacterium]|nr:hypothetical protein [Clostridia bacterium]